MLAFMEMEIVKLANKMSPNIVRCLTIGGVKAFRGDCPVTHRR